MQTVNCQCEVMTFFPPLLRRKKNLVWTFFTWGPTSQDTGGILDQDWITVHKDKLAFIAHIMHPLYGPSL